MHLKLGDSLEPSPCSGDHFPSFPEFRGLRIRRSGAESLISRFRSLTAFLAATRPAQAECCLVPSSASQPWQQGNPSPNGAPATTDVCAARRRHIPAPTEKPSPRRTR